MHFGLVISVLLHAAILGWTLLSFQSQRELRLPETQAVAVGMVTPSELTKMRLGTPTAKQPEAEAKESAKGELAKKEAAKSRPVPTPSPPPEPPPPKAEQKLDPIAQKLAEATPPPPPATAPPPAASPPPAAAPDEQKDADVAQAKAKREAEEQRQAEEKRKVEEQKRSEAQKRLEEQRQQAELKKKEEEKKKREAALKRKQEEERKRREAEAAKQKQKSFDDHMREQALLNKVPDKGAPPPPSAPPTEPTKAKGPAPGAPDGRDKQISASELAMIGQIIRSCMKANWTVLSGGASAQETAVRIRLRFNPNGTLSAAPEIVNPQRTAYFVAISESAMRAVQQCEPFNLPPAKYDAWKDIVLNFHPRDMY